MFYNSFIVHDLFMNCSWFVQDQFITCSWLVYGLLMSCSWLSTLDLFLTWSWLVLTCLELAHDVLMTCSLICLIHDFKDSPCSLFVNDLHMSCSLHGHDLFSSIIHKLFITCSWLFNWLVLDLVMTCSWLAIDFSDASLSFHSNQKLA